MGKNWDPGWVRKFVEASESVLEALRGAVELIVCQYRDKMAPRTRQEGTSLRIAKRMEVSWIHSFSYNLIELPVRFSLIFQYQGYESVYEVICNKDPVEFDLFGSKTAAPIVM